QHLSVRGGVKRQAPSGPVGHADEVGGLDLVDVHGGFPLRDREVHSLAGLGGEALERLADEPDEGKPANRETAEANELWAESKPVALAADQPPRLESR